MDFQGLIEDIAAAPAGSVVLLHMCAHNPSGVDPSDEQWQEILRIVREKNLLPFFDNAYQGFVSGDPNVDAYPVRLFAEVEGMNMIVACSFAKNMGLYGERCGALHVVCHDTAQREAIASQLRSISRAIYSTCPAYGARIVSHVLNTPALKTLWLSECAAMATRLDTVRKALFELLVQKQVKGTWSHVVAQRGMFSYTGIGREHVLRLRATHHVYLLETGRISLAGLNTHNLERFVDALVDVLGVNSA